MFDSASAAPVNQVVDLMERFYIWRVPAVSAPKMPQKLRRRMDPEAKRCNVQRHVQIGERIRELELIAMGPCLCVAHGAQFARRARPR